MTEEHDFAFYLHQLASKEEFPFEEFVELYTKQTYVYVYGILRNKEDAEDVVQEVFLKLYSMNEELFPTRGENVWYYKFCTNLAIVGGGSMMKNKFLSRKHLLILIGVIVLATISIILVLGSSNKVYPIDLNLADDEEVLLEYEYMDYLGYEHAGSTSDRAKIQKLGEILKRIQDENPLRIRKVEEKSGPVTYSFVVKRGNDEMIYSLKGEYLAVGKKSIFKTYTIYQLSQESSEELLSFLRSVDH